MTEQHALSTVIFTLNAGILSLLLSERVRMPSIIFYLIFGVLLGPYFLNLVQPQSLGPLFSVIIELGVALIVFEGAIHLNVNQYKSASSEIRNMLTIGVVISVACIMLLTKWLFAWPWGICLLFGVLISVTGPTVIAPILRKVPLKKPIGNILHWESILLEPIVVIGAILIVEFLIQTEITVFHTLLRLLKIIIVGAIIGGAFGYSLSFIMRRFPPKHEGFRNLMIIGIALLLFEVSNHLSSDSGLVAIVVAGMIFGNSNIPFLHEIKQFKETITRVMISFLFILLSANLNWNQLTQFSIPVIFLLISIMFVIRPATVFVSLANSKIPFNAKLFLALTAPRGIVAASMASLLTIVFVKQGSTQAGAFEILAYQVIFVTVFTQALWSQPLARLLKVRENEKRGFLIVGAHPLAVGIAEWLKVNKLECVLIDRDSYDVYLARKKGLSAYRGDALDEYFIEELPLQGVGNLLALTSNDEVNTLACQLAKRYLGQDNTYQNHKKLREKDESFLKAAGGNFVFPKLPALAKIIDDISKEDFVFQETKGSPSEDMIPLFIKAPNKLIELVTSESNFDEESIVFGLTKVTAK